MQSGKFLLGLWSLLTISGCADSIPSSAQADPTQLRAANRAIVVLSVEVAGFGGSGPCGAIELSRSSAAASANPVSTTHYLGGAAFTGKRAAVLSLEAGNYSITQVPCGGNPRVNFHPAPNKAFATFTVAAGEYVNLGRLLIIEHADTESAMAPFGSARLVPIVTDLDSELRASIRSDISPKLTTRLMNTGIAVSGADRRRMCELQRKRFQNSIPLNPNHVPLVCSLV